MIHAVGPCFDYGNNHDTNLTLLESAYKEAIDRAVEKELKSVAFCILSAGMFRGSCSLRTVIKTGLKAVASHASRHGSGLKTVVFCGFMPEEQSVLAEVMHHIGDTL